VENFLGYCGREICPIYKGFGRFRTLERYGENDSP
jgi:hypothetical protein